VSSDSWQVPRRQPRLRFPRESRWPRPPIIWLGHPSAGNTNYPLAVCIILERSPVFRNCCTRAVFRRGGGSGTLWRNCCTRAVFRRGGGSGTLWRNCCTRAVFRRGGGSGTLWRNCCTRAVFRRGGGSGTLWPWSTSTGNRRGEGCYFAGGTVRWPISWASSAGSRVARVAAQNFGASSR